MKDVSERLRAYDISILEQYASEENCLIGGIDEAGRGPLFGPVLAACVILDADAEFPGLNDSKQMTSIRRDALYGLICERARAVGLGSASVEEIDELNIRQATRLAMVRAARNAVIEPSVYVIDFEADLRLPSPQIALVRGDATSRAVAAASVIAKVERDRLMREMSEIYPGYGIHRHKGYGTPQHREALLRLGPTAQHRRTFIKKVFANGL